jgi:hypothetical protein
MNRTTLNKKRRAAFGPKRVFVSRYSSLLARQGLREGRRERKDEHSLWAASWSFPATVRFMHRGSREARWSN